MLLQTNILIYDADCRLCVMAKNILNRWDKHKKIEFIPFQDQDASHLLSDLHSTSCLDAMRFIDDEGFVLIGLDALRAVLYKLPGGFIFSSIFLLPGTYFLAKKSYSWIARNRYRLFGAVKSHGRSYPNCQHRGTSRFNPSL